MAFAFLNKSPRVLNFEIGLKLLIIVEISQRSLWGRESKQNIRIAIVVVISEV